MLSGARAALGMKPGDRLDRLFDVDGKDRILGFQIRRRLSFETGVTLCVAGSIASDVERRRWDNAPYVAID